MNLFQVTKKQPSGGLEIKTATGDIASFTTHYSEPLPPPFNGLNVKCTIVAKGGGGTPSTPIPIVGYSDVNWTRCGVNIWDGVTESGFIYNGSEGSDPSYWRTKNYIPIAPNTEYYFRAASGNGQINWYDKDKVFISAVNSMGGSTRLATSPANSAYVRFYQPVSSDASDSGINYPSSDTSYHAYNSQLITLSLGQTVYGGRLYFDNGWKCDVTHGYANIADLDFTPSTPASHIFRTDSIGSLVDAPTTNDDITTAISSCFKAMDFSSISGSDDGKFAIAGKNYAFIGRLVLIDHRYSTVEDFIAGNSTTQIIYPLVTPFTLDLSSSDMLDAVVSKNNVFSDCGVTSLTFIDKMQHYVDKKIAELQALILQ